MQVAVRSKACVRNRWLAATAGSNTAGSMDVCYECCVLSGKGLFDGLIPRPEETYRVCMCRMCVINCDNNPPHLPRVGRKGQNKKGGGMHMHIVKYTAKIGTGNYNQILEYRRCLSYSEDPVNARLKSLQD